MAWSLQDFTIYTEVDPNSKITVDADEITVTAINYADTAYVRKDFGADYFTGDFAFKLQLGTFAGLSGCWCLNNGTTSIQGMQLLEGVHVWTTSFDYKGVTYYQICITDDQNGGYGDNTVVSGGTTYYLLIERISGVVTCKIYTDAAMTNLFDTLNTGISNNTAYQYLYGYINYGLATAGTATTYIKNLYAYLELPQVATPTASPEAGSYDMSATLSVTLSCATSGASIYYTLDGSTPDNGSTLYTGAITLYTTTFVKAIAYKTDYTTSEVASFTYVYADAEEAYPYYHTRIRSLLDELAMRLEDAEQQIYPKNVKLKALQRGQLEVAKFIIADCVYDLQTIHSSLDCSSGEIALSSLTYNVLKDKEGVIRVKVTIGANTYWAVEIELKNLELLENEYFLDDDEVYFYVQNSKIKIVAQDLTSATADVFYVKIPREFTVYQSPDLPAQYDNMILEMAENYCWAIEGRYDRAKAAKDIALREIAFLNKKREEQQQLINIGVTFDF